MTLARRTFATNNVLRGLKTSEIRRATGHKSESAFEKYICYLMIKRGGGFLPLITHNYLHPIHLLYPAYPTSIKIIVIMMPMQSQMRS